MDIIGTTKLWDSFTEFPASREDFPEPANLVRVAVQPPWDDANYLFLHDAAIVEHKGTLFAAWYNCPVGEMVGSSAIRGRRSTDGGLTWGKVETIAADRSGSGVMYVPIAFLSHAGTLYAFVTNMKGGPDRVVDCEVFVLDEPTDRWESRGHLGQPFLPNSAPVGMADGNLIMAGRMAAQPGDYPVLPAVAIGSGDDPLAPWTCIAVSGDSAIPPFPESTAIVDGREVTLFVRNDKGAPILFRSADCGRTWNGPIGHDVPFGSSKIYAGTLSSGQRYFVANLRDYGRDLLALGVGRPGEVRFSSVWKLADGLSAELAAEPQWSYPCATEFDGKLHVVCTCEKRRNGVSSRGCALHIVPVASLAVNRLA